MEIVRLTQMLPDVSKNLECSWPCCRSEELAHQSRSGTKAPNARSHAKSTSSNGGNTGGHCSRGRGWHACKYAPGMSASLWHAFHFLVMHYTSNVGSSEAAVPYPSAANLTISFATGYIRSAHHHRAVADYEQRERTLWAHRYSVRSN